MSHGYLRIELACYVDRWIKAKVCVCIGVCGWVCVYTCARTLRDWIHGFIHAKLHLQPLKHFWRDNNSRIVFEIVLEESHFRSFSLFEAGSHVDLGCLRSHMQQRMTSIWPPPSLVLTLQVCVSTPPLCSAWGPIPGLPTL